MSPFPRPNKRRGAGRGTTALAGATELREGIHFFDMPGHGGVRSSVMAALMATGKVSELCHKHHVQRLHLFGSVARGQGVEGSDVDFVVQFKPMPPEEYPGHFFGLLHDLEDNLQRPVDLLTWEGIKRISLKKAIQADAVVIYEG